MKATCPKCEKPVMSLSLSAVTGMAENGTTWNCLVFACPLCNTAISADIDISAVRADILSAIAAK